MTRLLLGSLLCALLLASPVFAQEDAVSDFLSCDPLVIPAERLTCFDSILKQYKLRYGLLKSDAQSLARENRQHPRAVPQGRVKAESLERSQAEDASQAGLINLPDKFEARIIRTWNVGATDYVELDNGTIWKESGGTNLRSFGNEQVVISKGLFGGYRMAIGPSKRIVAVKRVD